MATAKNRAIDLDAARQATYERKQEELAREAGALFAMERSDFEAAADDEIGDDLLALIFTCCHPLLSREARVALTLRLLGGLTTPEIARAFLVARGDDRAAAGAGEADAARGAACRSRCRGERSCDERLPSVLEVDLPRSSTRATRRAPARTGSGATLCEEALRLGRILAELAPEEPEVARADRAAGDPGLAARRPARARRRAGAAARPGPRAAGTRC